jgi:hypothetical protein
MRALRLIALGMVALSYAGCEGQFGRMANINATPTKSAGRSWCAIDSHAGTRDCVYNSRDECMASGMWLSAGSCYENPFYRPTVAEQAAAGQGTAPRPTSR